VAKAILWIVPDTEARKLGEQTGLDTLVVLAVNDEHWVEVVADASSAEANVLSAPPGEYGRKAKTQRN
jgi:peroxiredoxin